MRRTMKKAVLNTVLVVLALTMGVSTARAAEETDGYALLIQQSPADGGSVTPGSGVHKIQIGQTVSLSAIPKPGYRFLYWLGDVTATGTTDTTIQVDSPKMVVAVFSREAYEEELPGVSLIKGSSAGGGGVGRLLGNPVQTPAGINPGSYYDPADISYVINPFVEEEESNDDIPVSGETDKEVPEPATVLMLGLGSLALLKRKKSK